MSTCTVLTPYAHIGDHWRELDLAAIVAAGFGDVPLIKLPLRCSACGALGHEIKVSGRSYGLLG
jgi:hypothetical protein